MDKLVEQALAEMNAKNVQTPAAVETSVEDEEVALEPDEEQPVEEEETPEPEEEEETEPAVEPKKDNKSTVVEPKKGDETFKVTREDKNDHAFREMRVKNKELEAQMKRLDTIAQGYGFKDNADMVARMESELIEKEAKTKGIDPTFYKELKQTQRELAELKQHQVEREKSERVNKFVSELDSFAVAYKLTQVEKEGIIEQMDADGYTVEMLMTIKNPRVVFKGYVEDKIAQVASQKEIERAKKKDGLQEEKFRDVNTTTGRPSMDNLADFLVKRATK